MELVKLISGWFPECQFLLVGDSLYSGKSVLRHVSENVDMIGHMHPKGKLYEAAPPRKAQRGAPRK